MDFLSLALRTFDLDGAAPRLHAIDLASRDVNLGAAAHGYALEISRHPSQGGPATAAAARDEGWLGAEAMVDPACTAVLRGAAADTATGADPEWMPI